MRDQVNDVAAFPEAMIVPEVFVGIDLERGCFVSLAQRAGIPKLSPSQPSARRFDALSIQVAINRDGSCLVRAHSFKIGSMLAVYPKSSVLQTLKGLSFDIYPSMSTLSYNVSHNQFLGCKPCQQRPLRPGWMLI